MAAGACSCAGTSQSLMYTLCFISTRPKHPHTAVKLSLAWPCNMKTATSNPLHASYNRLLWHSESLLMPLYKDQGYTLPGFRRQSQPKPSQNASSQRSLPPLRRLRDVTRWSWELFHSIFVKFGQLVDVITRERDRITRAIVKWSSKRVRNRGHTYPPWR